MATKREKIPVTAISGILSGKIGNVRWACGRQCSGRLHGTKFRVHESRDGIFIECWNSAIEVVRFRLEDYDMYDIGAFRMTFDTETSVVILEDICEAA